MSRRAIESFRRNARVAQRPVPTDVGVEQPRKHSGLVDAELFIMIEKKISARVAQR